MKRLLFALFTLVAVLSFSASTTSAVWAWGNLSWKIVPNPVADSSTNSSLSGVAAVSPHDIWAVGYFVDKQTETFHALTEHWNGAGWKIIASPDSSKIGLNAVAARASNDVWTVGSTNAGKTLVEHWNGHRWGIIPTPTPANAFGGTLLGVAALSPTDVWAVGSYITTTAQLTLIEHWNGHRWSIVSSPNKPSSANQLRGIAAVSANNIWAVGIAGTQTLVEHWNGHQWSIVLSPNVDQLGSRLFAVAAISANNIWAVGNHDASQSGEFPPAHTLVEHWNGHRWSIVPSPNVAGAQASLLLGVSIIASRDIWAVGETISDRTRALIEHWDGSQWSIIPSPTGTSESGLRAMTSVPNTKTVWAAGDVFTSAGRFTLTLVHR